MSRYDKSAPSPAYGGKLVENLTQARAASEAQRRAHDALIAAGAVWDGVDGYSFAAQPAPALPRGWGWSVLTVLAGFAALVAALVLL